MFNLFKKQEKKPDTKIVNDTKKQIQDNKHLTYSDGILVGRKEGFSIGYKKGRLNKNIVIRDFTSILISYSEKGFLTKNEIEKISEDFIKGIIK